MKDFLGQPITPGCWLVASGRGNRHAEYGMILYEVMSLTDAKKVKARRLTSHFSTKWEVQVSNLTIKEPTKYVVISPPEEAKTLFHNIVAGAASQKDKDRAAKWIHGQQVF